MLKEHFRNLYEHDGEMSTNKTEMNAINGSVTEELDERKVKHIDLNYGRLYL